MIGNPGDSRLTWESGLRPQPGAKAPAHTLVRLLLCGARARKEDYRMASLGDLGSRAGPNSQVCLLSVCTHPTSPTPFQDGRQWRCSLALSCRASHMSPCQHVPIIITYLKAPHWTYIQSCFLSSTTQETERGFSRWLRSEEN